MTYNSNDYANNTNVSYITNYSGTVKYYYLDENNNTIDLYFKCVNANFYIDANGNITWQSGEFLQGDWYNGNWYNNIAENENWKQSKQVVSIWHNGVWHNGNFYGGQWYNGTFNQGNFYSGSWYNGLFGYNYLINNDSCVWNDGYFYGGVFCGSRWNTGHYYTNNSYWYNKDTMQMVWFGGYVNDSYTSSPPTQKVKNNKKLSNYTGEVYYILFENNYYTIYNFLCRTATLNIDVLGNINITQGIYYNGVIKNANVSNSQLYNFQLENCTIKNTNIEKSNFLNCEIINNDNFNVIDSEWFNGEFSGIFKNSIWHNGYFNEGSFIGSTWYNGVWNQYRKDNLIWENSEWYDGEWYGGVIYGYQETEPPYIILNQDTQFNNFTGKLKYYNDYYYDTFQIIQLKNANIDMDWDGNILMTQGEWVSGVFENGTFINSTWINGTFNNGTFENSIWYDGIFNDGNFLISQWENGTFNNGTFENSIWHNGIFNNGTFKTSQWYNGTFFDGNWITLNSFWHNGEWVDGKQNGITPLNYKSTYNVLIIQQQLIDNIYTLQLLNNNIIIQLIDQNNNILNIKKQKDSFDLNDNSIQYLITNNQLKIYFYQTINNYIKLNFSYLDTNAIPTINYIDDELQYLQNSSTNLITGQFTYVVKNETEQKLYSIKVKDANFTIDNGYITWNHGVFQDGIWFDGNWNANTNILYRTLEIQNHDILNEIDFCLWKNGVWMNGNWNYDNSLWEDGVWVKGQVNNIECNEAPQFELGNGNSYLNYTGKIKYIYTNEENIQNLAEITLDEADISFDLNGYITFNKGNLNNGYWYNGSWFGDNWYNGSWHNGTWNCGVWHDGFWNNGVWITGTKYLEDYSLDMKSIGNYRTVGTKKVYSMSDIPLIGFFIKQPSELDNIINTYDIYKIYLQNGNILKTSSNILHTVIKEGSVNPVEQETEKLKINDVLIINDQYLKIINIVKYNKTEAEQYLNYYGHKQNYYAIQLYQCITVNNENSTAYTPKLTEQFVETEEYLVPVKQWRDSIWKDGFIQGIKSSYAPMYQIANNKSYNNYTEHLLYYIPIYDENNQFVYNQMFYFQCQNANFSISSEGNFTWKYGGFYNGEWNDGNWLGGQFNLSIWHKGVWETGIFNSGEWIDGQWYNGIWYTENSIWHNGVWHNGKINNYNSECEPSVLQADDSLLLNYTGKLRYLHDNKYLLLDVTSAYLAITNENVIFYKGYLNNGIFYGIWKTANFNNKFQFLTEFSHIKFNVRQNIIQYGEQISIVLKKGENINSFSLIKNLENAQTIELFIDTDEYISVWNNGNFQDGQWYNGEWIDGEWATDDNNIPKGKWHTGIIQGIVQKQPPVYFFVTDTNKEYSFQNFTGKIKYLTMEFDLKEQIVINLLETMNCKNAYFKIKYEEITEHQQSYKKIFFTWYNGEWINGTWSNGIWEKGIWYNGVWKMGRWLNGAWYNGVWHCGIWHNGQWYSIQPGKNIKILNMIKISKNQKF